VAQSRPLSRKPYFDNVLRRCDVLTGDLQADGFLATFESIVGSNRLSKLLACGFLIAVQK
jgi:hypothetical protein